ncbi:MAG: hypothetical protein U0350_39640 [Caldilineaceae bacterium]
MLQITADVFSGRPNPTWTVTDEKEAKAILKELAQNPTLIADTPVEAGLGFRGVLVEPISDHLVEDLGLSSSLYVPLNAGGFGAKGAEIAERLISLIPQASPSPQAGANALALDEALQGFLTGQLLVSRGASVADGAAVASAASEAAEAVAPHVTCYYDTSPYNPGFWNNDPNIRVHNNCYNYASNKRTDTFAQPGLGCGQMYREITCPEVTRAALCDGLHRRYDCFPDSEYPRYLVAMAVIPSPNPLQRDYHWYRKMREGFWAHKPGGTAVRNVDNSNHVIMDPATCDRGPYTQFCGYFYTCRSQKIK